MFIRIRKALVLGFWSVLFLALAAYTGAIEGIGWLAPVADALQGAVEQIRLGVVIAGLFALFGVAFLVSAVRALFRPKSKG